jgi:hypothetical protein
VLITALGSLGKHGEGDPKGGYTVLIIALGSLQNIEEETLKVGLRC